VIFYFLFFLAFVLFLLNYCLLLNYFIFSTEVSLSEDSGNILESVCSCVVLVQDRSAQHFSDLSHNEL